MSVNVYQIVTDKVLEELAKGTVPWRKPWAGVESAPKNLVSDRRYTGINPFLLQIATIEGGFKSPYWLTFKQAKELGGSVRKGEHGTLIVFFKILRKSRKDETTGKKTEDVIPLLRYYRVFNIDQTDGVRIPKGRVTHPEPRTLSEPERRDAAEAIIAGYPNPPRIVENEPEAWYRPDADLVNLPPRELFDEADEFYSTAFHELGHSTGHKGRLNRLTPAYFGSHEYGREELVAEMTSTFLAAEAGIDTTVENSAAYLRSWMQTISEDVHAVVTAAAQAQRAADYILDRQQAGESENHAAAAA